MDFHALGDLYGQWQPVKYGTHESRWKKCVKTDGVLIGITAILPN